VQTPEAPPQPPKLGLALSGGGFRASFFHVGVFARLAELGVLRHLEVISTVSGGSIVGALYYIRLRTLLQSKPDAEITDDDYVELVAGLEKEFLAGVQRNIRARVVLNPFKNAWMTVSTSYSRSDRIGDLYDLLLYKPAWPEARPKREGLAGLGGRVEKQIELRELRVDAPGEPPDFNPTEDNARRSAKVPALVLNATSLNTGHSWCFEVVRMGEPEPYLGLGADDIDVNLRLGQGALLPTDSDERVSKQDDFPLGLAVAASAGVPALFHPLAISDLYGGGIRVELVDGGVHDNQGVQALLDKKCTRFIVSDASGQMEDQPRPATHVIGVAGRSTGIYGDSLRDEQLLHVIDRGAPEARNQPVALMHLRKGLPRPVRAPRRRDGTGGDLVPGAHDAQTRVDSSDFGVDERAQRALARIRTDLDAFSDIEAHSLMVDGYLMTDLTMLQQTRLHEFVSQVPSAPIGDVPERWSFRLAAPLIAPESPEWYLKRLAVGKERFLKPGLVFAPKAVWNGLAALLLAAIVVLVLLSGWLDGSWPIAWVLGVALGALAFLAIYVLEIPPPTTPVAGPIFVWVRFLVSLALVPVAVVVTTLFGLLTWLSGRLHVRLGKLPR
jgi:NTE family protein